MQCLHKTSTSHLPNLPEANYQQHLSASNLPLLIQASRASSPSPVLVNAGNFIPSLRWPTFTKFRGPRRGYEALHPTWTFQNWCGHHIPPLVMHSVFIDGGGLSLPFFGFRAHQVSLFLQSQPTTYYCEASNSDDSSHPFRIKSQRTAEAAAHRHGRDTPGCKRVRREGEDDLSVGDKSGEPHSVRLSWLRWAFERLARGELMHTHNQQEEAARGSGDLSDPEAELAGVAGPVTNDDSSPKRFLEQNPALQKFLEHTYDSYQNFIAALKRSGVPDYAPWMLELCRRVLGDTSSTRTMVGEQELREPFFHHGDLIVQGRLRVLCPFVITGSLTVDGFMADAGPDSSVAVGGNVNAHAVYTDGEMYVGGDIEAEVVYGYYNDNTLQAGTIRARLVIEDEHCTEARMEADVHFDLDTYRQGYGEGVQEQLREVLVDEVFTQDDDEARLDHRALYSHLWEGKSVFRLVD
ncbi:hypothetical protein EDB81DRAFT_861766 [Dactylonectria macrodidyma]|uniref:Uncharacterized protein n=1 Tax=Dactylonectria macrodidyma TaxID=307937 RepID=A0A9P9IET7_9HYPO|nr:hypothetical protein EDB81DRAFT_861766 [Dactylonectria macrodidyma]